MSSSRSRSPSRQKKKKKRKKKRSASPSKQSSSNSVNNIDDSSGPVIENPGTKQKKNKEQIKSKHLTNYKY